MHLLQCKHSIQSFFFKVDGSSQRIVIGKNHFRIHDGDQLGSVLQTSVCKVSSQHFLYGCRICHAGPYPVVGNSCLGILHLHPGFGGLPHILHAAKIYAVRNYRRHTIQHLNVLCLFAVVCDCHAAYQCTQSL